MDRLSSKAIKKNKKKLFFETLLSVAVLLFMLVIIFDSKTYIKHSQDAILLWANNVLPSLYIFFIFSKLLAKLNVMENISAFLSPILSKLFKTGKNSSYIFFLSILSGYPVGAMLINESYKLGKISSEEAHKLTTFTSLTGPAFIFGTVGTLMLKNTAAGAIIYFSHLSSAILNGILFRNIKISKASNLLPPKKISQEKNILSESISSATASILLIGGYIVFFYITLQILIDTALLPTLLLPIKKLLNFDILPIINGIFEVTKGCKEISAIFCVKTATPIISFLISFGGLCIHFQSFHFLKDCGVKYSFYLKQKFSHAFLSMILSLPLSFILL